MATQTISYTSPTGFKFTNAECVFSNFTTNSNPTITTISSNSGCLQASDGSKDVYITKFNISDGTCTADSGATVLNPIILSFSTFPLIIGETSSIAVNLIGSGVCPPMQVTFTILAASTTLITLSATFNNEIAGTVTFEAINPGNNFTYNIIDCTLV